LDSSIAAPKIPTKKKGTETRAQYRASAEGPNTQTADTASGSKIRSFV
jgi:hypothetical protein